MGIPVYPISANSTKVSGGRVRCHLSPLWFNHGVIPHRLGGRVVPVRSPRTIVVFDIYVFLTMSPGLTHMVVGGVVDLTRLGPSGTALAPCTMGGFQVRY